MKLQRRTDAPQHGWLSGRLWLGLKIVSLCAVVALMVAAAVITLRQRFTSTGPYRTEYEGRVMDKSVTLGETQTGSYPVRRLLIRGKGGDEFQIIVNESLYNRAQVGMWIKNGKAGAELSSPGQ